MVSETEDNGTAVTEIKEKGLMDSRGGRAGDLNASEEGVGEDQEEGELSEKEDVNGDDKPVSTEGETQGDGEGPMVRRKVSLGDLTSRATKGSQGRDDYMKRGGMEKLGTEVEETTWLRDKVAFRPATTSYAPNLYNFAWAQAVQGNQGFKHVEKPGVDDETEELAEDGADFDEDDEIEDELPDSLVDPLKIPEGYDMRQVLYGRRLMKNASWNASRGDNRRDKAWLEPADSGDPRRRFERGERAATRGRREPRSPSRKRDGRVPSRRDRLEGDPERDRGSDKDRVSESERQRIRDRERARDKGKERGDRNESSVRAASSEDSDQSRRSVPSGANGKQAQNGDNLADVREEGEIEEGEIEIPPDSLRSRSTSLENPEEPRADSPVEDGLPSGNLKKSLSSRLSFRNPPTNSRSVSKESSFRRLQDDDLRHRLTKDAEREKSREEAKAREERREQIAHLTALMKSVTVKDAQKAFINTCVRLENAVRILKLFSKQKVSPSVSSADDLPRDISKMATKVFQGLRAVYAVWNTASGREQERDRDTFPRLLQFVTGSCLKFFSPKQARELEEFLDHVTKTGRRTRMEGSMRQVSAPKPADVLQETGVRQRELSANTAVSNPKMASSLGRISEGSPERDTDTKDAMAEAAIAAAALAYAQSSAAALANFPHGSTYQSNQPTNLPTIVLDQWGWNGSTEPYEQSMSPGLPPGYSSASMAGRPFVSHGVAAQTNGSNNSYGVGATPPSTSSNGWTNANKKVVYDAKSPYGPGYLEEDWEDLSPPSQNSAYGFSTRKVVKLDERGFPISSLETINTAAPQNKVGNLPVSLNFRLASPTPSEEDDEPGRKNTITSAAAVANGNTQSAHIPLHQLPKPPGTMPAVTAPFYKALNTRIDDTGRVHYASVPLVAPATVNQDFSLNLEEPKNQSISGPVALNLRSRDPRRQLQNGYLDLEVPPQQSTSLAKYTWSPTIQTVEKKRGGDCYARMAEPSKRLKVSSFSDAMQNLDSSAGAFAMGGWLEEGAVTSPGHDVDGVQAMDIDLDSPTPDRKPNLDDELAGINMEKIEIPSGIGSSEMRSRQLSDVFNYNLMKPEAQAAEEVLGQPERSWEMEQDVGRHRMRPRDPRRVLLETAAEPVQANYRNAQANEATDSGVISQYSKRNSPPPNTSSTFNHQLSTSILGNAHDQRKGHLNPNEMNQTINSSLLSKQLYAGQTTAAAKEEAFFNERSNENGREPNKNRVSETRDISTGEPTREEISNHVDPWDPLLRKPRFGPSHWGGSDIHRGFEHMLETVTEVERASLQIERKRRMQEQDRMFSAGKLCLVLDLDHTLLNSAKFAEIEPEWEVRLRSAESMERARASKEGQAKQELFRFPHMSMWTKLRPGIWKFLAKASELYELHVYTMGNKAYATEMAKLLDPTGKLFAGRVISKGDEVDGVDKSKDLDGVLGMESAVVIIDDSSRVWPHHRENLIVVERYMYFPSSRRQFGLAGPSLLEVGHDERAVDGMLSSASGVIDRIHKSFFSNKRLREVDVRAILASEQRRVLAGCHVLFSRIFPVGEANPHLHPLWRLADQFGASCCLHINDKVTHVVAISLGTDKVNWAAATGRPVVRPAWLEASAILYRRVNEQDFPVPP